MSIETEMNRRLLVAGSVLFLIGLLTGFAVPLFHNPRSGLSAHLEGVMNGIFLLAMGAVWGRVALSSKLRRAAEALLLVGAYANWLGTLLSAALGTSKTTPIAGAGFSAAPAQETLVTSLLGISALAMVFGIGIAAVGLSRGREPQPAVQRQRAD